MKKILLFLAMTIGVFASKFDGIWNGNLDVFGTKLPLVLRLNENGGTMDSPNQNAFGIELSKVEVSGSKLRIEIASIGATFTGTLQDGIIKGRYIQMGQGYELKLERGEYIKEKKVLNRPQEPKEPFSYNVEEVKFQSQKEKFYLSGTLTTPKDKKNIPLVILVSGSGANDRNEELFGHKPFLLLSDYLTSRGIGVFRYDDRGVGESEGIFEGSTTEDFAKDLLGAIEKMRELGYKNIGVLGHSEGGLVTNIAYNKGGKIDFIIHLASPSQRGKELLISQTGAILDSIGLDSMSKSYAMGEITSILNLIVEDKKDVDEEIRKVYEKNPVYMTPEQKKYYVNQKTAESTSIWYKYFVKYNPYEHIKNIDVETLALYGTKDIQVSSKENIEILNKIGNENIKVVEVEGVNHLFQKAQKGSIDEYEKIEETISEEVLNIIYKWILEKSM